MSEVVRVKINPATAPPPDPRAPRVRGLNLDTRVFCMIPVTENSIAEARTASSPIGMSASLHRNCSSIRCDMILLKTSPNIS